jgi:hypothetical protein
MMKWSEQGNLWLLTPAEFDQLPDGIELGCIDDTTVVKGRDRIDDDTRAGHLAYGIRDPFEHPLREVFMEWYLRRNM